MSGIHMALMAAGGLRPIALTLSASTQGYNIFSAAGSPSDPVDVLLTINAGVVVSAALGASALITGSFAPGSKIRLVNNGAVQGHAGVGGAGGAAGGPGSNGGVGGDAISLQFPITIDNGGGNIFGGGGGGGGGAGATSPDAGTAAGGGGGGGRGNVGHSGGAAGAGQSGGTQPQAGVAGTSSAPGGGGNGGSRIVNLGGVPPESAAVGGGQGGTGGDWGAAGASGAPGQISRTDNEGVGNGYDEPNGTPGTGGAPGYAIRQNGHAVTWVAGNNSTQVKGSVA